MRNRIISITGNTAVGTTTLTSRLSQLKEWKACYSEPHLHNSPYFNKFLRDPKAWAFHNQVFFIAEYVEMYQHVTTQMELMNEILCLDYSIFEILIYTEALKMNGALDYQEAEVIFRIFDLLRPGLVIPDLLICLSADTEVLLSRMEGRSRKDEENIDKKYIEALQTCFSRFFKSWDKGPVLLVDSSNMNFIEDDQAVVTIAEQALDRIP